MRTVLNHIKNETLDEIKTSLENLWQRMIQLFEFFQYSFVLILKLKCLVGASRVRCVESGTASTVIYTRWSSRRYELGCDAPVIRLWKMNGLCMSANVIRFRLSFVLQLINYTGSLSYHGRNSLRPYYICNKSGSRRGKMYVQITKWKPG